MIISFSQLGKHGRLGNQLFQITSTLGIAEKNQARAVFPEWEYAEFFEMAALSAGTVTSPQMREIAEFGGNQWVPPLRVEESAFHHYDWSFARSSDIRGYLQSEKYFGSVVPRLKDEFLMKARESFQSACPGVFDKPTICIQIRRGDYVGNPNYIQIPITWYIDALFTNFPNWRDCNIVITSDDIEYCKVHFECLPNAFFSPQSSTKGHEGKSDVFDLALMSLCDHFILSNSSFGWWGAWLAERRGLDTPMSTSATRPPCKIIHPARMFMGKLAGNNIKDYWPERWIVHEKLDYRIPLRDVTFTIPVAFDHVDRKKNLDLGLCLLQMALDAKFIVCEQAPAPLSPSTVTSPQKAPAGRILGGGRKFEYVSQWAKYMPFEGRNFHRTKMLNDMALAAETEFIVNWDCDVIIPPLQIFMAVEQLRAGADMVFPYGGPFARMPRDEWFSPLEKALDIGIVGATPFQGREVDHFSVGGAVMFNKEAFMDGGMENENMVSFGPEDVERYERFKRLGYDIRRVKGTLFHLNHYTGPNSSRANPFFKQNHAELERIRRLEIGEFRKDVEGWSWRPMYTTGYYKRISEGAVRAARVVMEALERLGVGREALVIDVGCGVGEWSNGNPNYWGLDFRVREKDLTFPRARYIECNLNESFVEVHDKFDLCLCLEVAEHIQSHRAGLLVDWLCTLSDRVLFSAAIPYQGGQGHVNEQWQSWWAEHFRRNGFGAAEVQPDLHQCEEVELWYRNNLVLYQRGAKGEVRDFVLPAFYVEICKGLRGARDREA